MLFKYHLEDMPHLKGFSANPMVAFRGNGVHLPEM